VVDASGHPIKFQQTSLQSAETGDRFAVLAGRLELPSGGGYQYPGKQKIKPRSALSEITCIRHYQRGYVVALKKTIGDAG